MEGIIPSLFDHGQSLYYYKDLNVRLSRVDIRCNSVIFITHYINKYREDLSHLLPTVHWP